MSSYPVLAVLNLIVLGVSFVFTGLFNAPDGQLFPLNATTYDYTTEAAPADWVFNIWYFIYTSQTIWALYTLFNLCRGSGLGEEYQMYNDPEFIPSTFLLFSVLANALHITWTLLVANGHLIYSVIILSVYTVAVLGMLVIINMSLRLYSEELAHDGRMFEVWFSRFLISDWIALQGFWLIIEILISTSSILVYIEDLIDSYQSGIASMSMMACIIAVWFFLEVSMLDNYTRYSVAPYIAAIIYFAGIHTENKEGFFFILSMSLIIMCVMFMLIKIVMASMRSVTRPLY